MGQLPHLDAAGHAHMVDVGGKADTERLALAEATVRMEPATTAALFGGDLPKGDALAVARIAGIQAAKKTSELVPLCHPLALTSVSVDVERIDAGARIIVRVGTTGPTGVEMEALTAASVAALTIYDMVKGLERGVEIGPVRLLEKSGGRSGSWQR
ncbi:MAG: cyclic pyranopterin monophosphate synthase MoaC [Acidimicrobiia bacterium]|nr:cyclic pyranopterin monophosphate synthase MoaC [Acidimicrobiia bacterium]MBT8192566.1 cyclic pyranopterin monophosphate synthase MoaC [Acidimicrobiia bacterium]NNF89571.1 cyclic pyranopterin monophosphate synthase MoaC [Acidimicrobiia bacterium]NNJ46566.1 cyclic pyranopterin monophosphate synthase MoaC [Acidimicrobiia bacterium]NNL14642.1 cyclic pyranopterin monophosphate synthase MoaC [Acidimicrobiia bacterium]